MRTNIRKNIKKLLVEFSTLDEFNVSLSIGSNFTHEDLNDELGKRSEKKIGNNTVLRRLSNGDIAIRYHYTDIITINIMDNIKVNTGGWDTSTTIQRLNKLLPDNVHLYKKKGELFIKGSNGTFEFMDGMIVNQNGDIHTR